MGSSTGSSLSLPTITTAPSANSASEFRHEWMAHNHPAAAAERYSANCGTGAAEERKHIPYGSHTQMAVHGIGEDGKIL